MGGKTLKEETGQSMDELLDAHEQCLTTIVVGGSLASGDIVLPGHDHDVEHLPNVPPRETLVMTRTSAIQEAMQLVACMTNEQLEVLFGIFHVSPRSLGIRVVDDGESWGEFFKKVATRTF